MAHVRYDAMFFDAGMVLLDFPNWEERIRTALTGLGHRPTEAQIRAGADAALAWLQTQPEQDLLPTWEAEDQHTLGQAQAIVDRVGIADLDPRYIRDTCYFGYVCRPFPEVLTVLQELRDLGLGIGVISNAPPSLRAVLTRLGITALVDHITLSSDIGVLKPNADIYRHALKALGTEARSSVFADDLPQNVEGARAVGFGSAYVVDRAQVTGRPDAIRTLNVLPALLAATSPIGRLALADPR